MAWGLIALGFEIRNDAEDVAAFGFFRTRRAIGREDGKLFQLGPQMAQAIARIDYAGARIRR